MESKLVMAVLFMVVLQFSKQYQLINTISTQDLSFVVKSKLAMTL